MYDAYILSVITYVCVESIASKLVLSPCSAVRIINISCDSVSNFTGPSATG